MSTDRPRKVEEDGNDVSRFPDAVVSQDRSGHFTESAGSVCVDVVLIVLQTDAKEDSACRRTRGCITGWG